MRHDNSTFTATRLSHDLILLSSLYVRLFSCLKNYLDLSGTTILTNSLRVFFLRARVESQCWRAIFHPRLALIPEKENRHICVKSGGPVVWSPWLRSE